MPAIISSLTGDRQQDYDRWDNLRTGNPIESVYAILRHRIVRTKGALSQKSVAGICSRNR